MKKRRTWPLFLIALPAGVAVWTGWVGLGALCGFGVIHPLPGIWDAARLNTAITLPIGVEAYGGYALGIWADKDTPKRVRRFAFRSAIGSLLLGLLGQVSFHLLNAAGYTRAPWPVVVFVSCIPVAALGFGMGLHQLLIHTEADEVAESAAAEALPVPALSRVTALETLAGTITRAIPEPERWPDAPLPEPAREQAGPEIEAALDAWDRPAVPSRPVPPEPEAEPYDTSDLFGTESAPEPAPEPAQPEPVPARTAPRPPAATGRATRAELLAQRTAGLPVPREVSGTWTPEAAGLTGEQARRIVAALPRNDLVDFLHVSRGAATRIKNEYGQPALAGANGSR